MHDAVDRKLKALRSQRIPKVEPWRVIDLTTGMDHQRVAFPYAVTPPFEVLDLESLAAALKISPDLLRSSHISEPMDVSSKFGVPCNIVANAYARLHDHVGSHADSPSHFGKEGTYENAQYNGPTTILDISDLLTPETERGRLITTKIVEKAARRTGLQLSEVGRLIINGYRQAPETWDDHFPYLDRSSAKFLADLPKLVLFGTTAPSVEEKDTPVDHAHHALYAGGVAILEGLNPDHLLKQQRSDGVLYTRLQLLHPSFTAKQATASFFPTANLY